MKNKKCPYCGRRIGYFTIFREKKHGIYKCARCKKESKIKIDLKMLLAFLGVVLLTVLYIVLWRNSSFYNDFSGILPPVIILLVFYFLTPLFINFVPLKNVVEENKTQKERVSLNEKTKDKDFIFNKKIFDQIKNNRQAPKSIDEKIDAALSDEPKVPVIKDVSEAHASSSDAPLKKVNRAQHFRDEEYIPPQEEEIKTYTPSKSKPDGSKYTANRKL